MKPPSRLSLVLTGQDILPTDLPPRQALTVYVRRLYVMASLLVIFCGPLLLILGFSTIPAPTIGGVVLFLGVAAYVRSRRYRAEDRPDRGNHTNAQAVAERPAASEIREPEAPGSGRGESEDATHALDELAVAAARGSDSAWVQVFSTLMPRTLAYLRLRGLSRDIAEDIAQGAFLRAVGMIDRWDPQRGPFATWFFMIVRARSREYERRIALHPHVRVPGLEQGEQGAALDALEDRIMLDNLLRDLAPEQREILFLRYFYQLSTAEIATIMDTSPEAVRQRLSAIRKTLGQRTVLGDSAEP